MSTTRNPEIENQLNVVYNNDYEFVEPYDGKKGHYPAEIYIERGTVYPIINTCDRLGIRDDIMADHLGYRGGMVQLIFKTEAALNTFKQELHRLYMNLVISAKTKHVTFFKYTHKETGPLAGFLTQHPDLGYTTEDIEKTFDIEPGLISSIGPGYECIYLYARDKDALHQVTEKIKSGMTKLFHINFDSWDFKANEMCNMLQIGGSILVDMQKAVYEHTPSHCVPGAAGPRA